MMFFVVAVIAGAFGSIVLSSIVYRRLRTSRERTDFVREDGSGVRIHIDAEEELMIGSNNNNNNNNNNNAEDNDNEDTSKYIEEKIQHGGRVTYKTETSQETKTKTKLNEDELWEIRRVSVFIGYLERTYWSKNTSSFSMHERCEATKDDLKPVLRISKSERKIHIVYSKNTLWNLAFCDNLQTNKNEKFAFIFKGIKSWSIEETRGRFSDVMQDLFEFRAEIRQELINERADLFGILPECCKIINEKSSVVSATGKINQPKPIVPFCGNPQGHDVVCQSAQLNVVDDESNDWKVDPPEGLELLIPSVCFVIPSKETEVAGHACGLELQFKHLLTAWNDQGWETKQALTSSEIMSVLKIFKPATDEEDEIMEELVEEENEQLAGNDLLVVEESVEAVVQLDLGMEDEAVVQLDLGMEAEAADVESNIESDIASDAITVSEQNDVMAGGLTVSASSSDEEISSVDGGPISFYDALLLGDDVLMSRDQNMAEDTCMSRDQLMEEDICIASVEEILYRLENVLQMFSSKNENIEDYTIEDELQMLNNLQNELDEDLYPQYKQITTATSYVTSSSVKRNVDLLIERWNFVVFALRERGQRLIGAGVDGRVTTDLLTFLCDVEEALTSQHGVTATPEDLAKQYTELGSLQNGFATFESRLKKLKESAEKTPSGHHDEVHRIVARWDRSYIQTQARREQLGTLKERISKFREGLLHQTEWLEKVYEKLKTDETVLFTWSSTHVSQHYQCNLQNHRMLRLLKEYVGISRKLTRQRRGIQKTFYGAEEFILSSKMYEKDLKDFYFHVHGCDDDTCRYDVDRSRDWVANMTLKLSQLYEAVISELLYRTNVLLTNTSLQEEAGAVYDGDHGSGTEYVDYDDGDNNIETKREFYYNGNTGTKTDYYNDGDNNDGTGTSYRDNDAGTKSDVYDGDNTGSKTADYNDGDNSYYWEDEFEDVMKWMEVRELDLANEIPSYKSMAELSAYVSKLQDIRSDIVSNDEKVASTLEAFYDTIRKCQTRPNDVARDDICSKVVPLELRWSKLQWESEGRNARVIALHDVTHNYDKVCQPFLKWLRKAEIQSEALNRQWMSLDADTQTSVVVDACDVNASHLEHIETLRMRQNRFLRDVTHHEEDLRKVNRFGETLISLVKEFQMYITDFPDSLSTGVNGTSQIWDLERSLYEINERYRTLQYSLELSGKSRNLLAEKHKIYIRMVETYITWVNETECEISVEIQETTNLTQQRVSRKLDAVTRIRRDVHEHLSQLVAIQMTSDDLSTLHIYAKDSRTRDVEKLLAEIDSADNSPVLWEAVTHSINARYEKLCADVRAFESHLQSLVTDHCVVNEGIEILLKRAISVEQLLAEMGMISSDAHTLSQQIKKIRTITFELEVIKDSLEVASTNVEQAEEHGTREEGFEHKETLFERLNTLKTLLVDLQFDVYTRSDECIAACLDNIATFQQWLSTVSSDLHADSAQCSSDISSAEENITNMTNEVESYGDLFRVLIECGRELMLLHMRENNVSCISDLSLVVTNLNNNWHAVSIELLKRGDHVDAVVMHSKVYNKTFHLLFRWLERMEEYMKRFTTASLNAHVLSSQAREQKALLNDAYSHNGTVEAYSNMAESSLYHIYCRYPNERGSEPNPVELEKIKSVRDRFEHIISTFECRCVNLKAVLTQLEEYTNAYRELTTWLQCSAHAQITSRQIESTLEGAVQQFEACRVYERDLDRVSAQVEHMLKLGWKLVDGKQGRVDDVTEMKLENEKIRLRWEVIRKMAVKNIKLFRSALEKSFVHGHEHITCMLRTKHEEVTCKLQSKQVSDESEQPGTDIETYVTGLSDELLEWETELNVFYQAAELLTKRCQEGDVNVDVLVHQVDEAWRKLGHVIQHSNFPGDVICLKDPDEIRDIIRRDNQTSEEFDDVTIQNPDVAEIISSVNRDNNSIQIPHFLLHTSIPLFTRPTCSDDRLDNRVQLGCHKLNSLENYTYLKSTVERHTRVDRSHVCNKPQCKGRLSTTDVSLPTGAPVIDELTSPLLAAGETAPESENLTSEKVLTTPDQKSVSKITTTNVRRVERLILRRKYVNEMGEECVEEKEIPESEKEKYMSGEKECLDAGAVIVKSPDENESTTTEEEFVRDVDGNVTEWIVRKRTRLTKRTRIVRKSIIKETSRKIHDNAGDISTDDTLETGDGNAYDTTTRVGRVVKRPEPPSFAHSSLPENTSVTSTFVHIPRRVVKRPPVPPSFAPKLQESNVSITTTVEKDEQHSPAAHLTVDGSHVTPDSSHVTQVSHNSHISIPPLTSVNNNNNNNNNNNSVGEDFTALQLKCMKGSLRNGEDHRCPKHTFSDVKQPEAERWETGNAGNGINSSNCTEPGEEEQSDSAGHSLLKVVCDANDRRQVELACNENDHRHVSAIYKYEREHKKGKLVKVYKRLDTGESCALVDNNTEFHSFQGNGEIFTTDWLPQQRRKRVKVMIIVSDKSNNLFGEECRAKYHISPRNSLYLRNLTSPMLLNSTSTPLVGSGDTEDKVSQSKPHIEPHIEVHTEPQREVQNGTHVEAQNGVHSEAQNESEGKSVRRRSRKKSYVKITVGENNREILSCSSSSNQNGGAVVVRDRHNRIRTMDVVPAAENVDVSRDEEWKPAMRILTRNATKIVVSHSNRCLVTSDARLEDSNHCEGDANSSFAEKKSVVSVTLTSKT